ncbi:MAG: AMP-binding protein, partial [Nocardioidaceae bacterium]
MREYEAPMTYVVPESGNLSDDVVANARDYPDDVVLRRRSDEVWQDVTAAHFRDEVAATAKGLVAAGVQQGDRVALVSKTRYEWTLLDYAIWFAGAVTVPVYETSSADQIGWILSDAEAVLAVVETADHVQRIDKLSSELPELRQVVCIDAGDLDELVDTGAGVGDDALEERRTSATPDSLATLIYTSGTTGRPKGCRLTHGNFMFELEVAVEKLDDLFELKDASTLLFLPLAHVFARIIQVGCIKRRVIIG